jgi:hypothetical protein
VIEGSRYKPHLVEPEIHLELVCRGKLDLLERTLNGSPLLFPDRFAEADLGIADATFEDFVHVIKNLNKNTDARCYYVYRLFPVNNNNHDLDVQGSASLVTVSDRRSSIMNANKKPRGEIVGTHNGKAIEQSRIDRWLV